MSPDRKPYVSALALALALVLAGPLDAASFRPFQDPSEKGQRAKTGISRAGFLISEITLDLTQDIFGGTITGVRGPMAPILRAWEEELLKDGTPTPHLCFAYVAYAGGKENKTSSLTQAACYEELPNGSLNPKATRITPEHPQFFRFESTNIDEQRDEPLLDQAGTVVNSGTIRGPEDSSLRAKWIEYRAPTAYEGRYIFSCQVEIWPGETRLFVSRLPVKIWGETGWAAVFRKAEKGETKDDEQYRAIGWFKTSAQGTYGFMFSSKLAWDVTVITVAKEDKRAS